MKVCNILNPKTGIEAKFSYKMISAMVMHEINTSKIESFSENLNKNEKLVEFMKIIEIYPNENITTSLLGHKMSESLWKMIKSEDLLPSEWIWNNYN